jgi:predicted Ser/Thr protein kinase/CHASE2 domain-containing sensor protein
MSVAIGCPNLGKLAEYARQPQATSNAAELDRHLAACPRCLNEYIELAKRSFVPTPADCHIVREIGRGRFGVVYKAWWKRKPPQVVALKILTFTSEAERTRFDREAAVLKRLDSTGIVKCLESGQIDGAPYYIMEYVDGLHLNDYFTERGAGLDEKLTVLQRVCRAVSDAHALGVVHRDLKPRNILVDAYGQPHVLDFGICAVGAGDWTSWARKTLTQTGDVLGTLQYMSPEQAWGGTGSRVDFRSDIWALGVMLYEIVTDGDYPYSHAPMPGKPAGEALLERIRKELPRLPSLTHLPRGRDLEVLVERCLAWEPSHRIASVAKLADDLERYCRGQRIKTRSLSYPYRLKRLAVGVAVRARWAFSIIFLAMMAWGLWTISLLFEVGWLAPARGAVPRRPSGGPIPTAEDIVIAGISDETVKTVFDRAQREPIGDGTLGPKSTELTDWRALNGYLMERLAAARPRAVVWDYFFATTESGDERFVAGMQRLEAAGIPILVAARAYHVDGTPEVSTVIAEQMGRMLRHGVVAAYQTDERPGEFFLAIRRSEVVVIPHLAVSTLAAILEPAARPVLEWRGRELGMVLLYEVEPGLVRKNRDHLEATRTYQSSRNESGLRSGDMVATSKVKLRPPEFWEQRTIPYESLLFGSEDENKAALQGKLLMIGDLQRTRKTYLPDWHEVEYGPLDVRKVPGCYILADAVAGLLEGRRQEFAFPLAAPTFLAMLLVGIVGCVVPIKLAETEIFVRRNLRRGVGVSLPAAAAVSVLVMIFADRYTVVHAGMAGFSFFTPLAGAFWVETVRNQHRMAAERPVVPVG